MSSKLPASDRIAVRAGGANGAEDYRDPVIQVYLKGVDRTLLRENLKLTVQQRFEKFERFMDYVFELRKAGRRSRAEE